MRDFLWLSCNCAHLQDLTDASWHASPKSNPELVVSIRAEHTITITHKGTSYKVILEPAAYSLQGSAYVQEWLHLWLLVEDARLIRITGHTSGRALPLSKFFGTNLRRFQISLPKDEISPRDNDQVSSENLRALLSASRIKSPPAQRYVDMIDASTLDH